jgi:cytochrome c oxidase cbb3-type subunit III
MSGFWHWFIVVISVGSMIGCLWLLFANARRGANEADDTGHVWDDDLRERNNPLPRWWLNLFVLTVVFGFGYLALYPGLGNFRGTLGWTQQGQAQAALDAVNARRAALHEQFRDKDFAALAHDPAAQSLGREVFLRNCAGCHGADARGALGFPNLADADWLYGGTPEAIVVSISAGRRGVMPPFNGMLPADAVKALADFIPRWSDPRLDAGTRAAGLGQYAVTCAACHGADGRGNPALGAPDLTDAIWLYGGTSEHVRQSILFGRSGNMPAHTGLLSADDIRLVAAYVYGLSAPPAH